MTDRDDALGVYRTDIIESELLLTLAFDLLVKTKRTRVLNSICDEADKALDENFDRSVDTAKENILAARRALEVLKDHRIDIYLEKRKGKNER